MKIKPVILCGGSGTRLWPNSKVKLPKQFIDFGGWTLIDKTLERIKSPIFDYPVISTNSLYVKLVKKYLTKHRIKKYKIILEPFKKNTAPAILSAALIDDIPYKQQLIFFPADHLIEKVSLFNKSIILNKKFLDEKNIFIFGIKPTYPSSEYGYFLTKKISKNLNKVDEFIEKPQINNAKKIIKKKGYWNSGILFARKDSIINNFRKYQFKMYKHCNEAMAKSFVNINIYKFTRKVF